MSPTDRLASVQYTVEELRAAVQAAESVGTYVMAHAYTPESISRCVVAGVHSIEHGNLLDEATAKLMADRNVFLVPTLVAYEKLRDEGPAHDLARENLNKLGDVLDAGLQSLRIALDAGVRIASGSDLLGPLRRFQGEEIEIKSRVLGPLAAITATTRTNAELLGLENEIGTIEPGKRADLLVVNGDVLDDPSLVGDPEHVSLVLQGGRFSVNHLP
jgi:imidazolonepropionase-like amidohydrolase